MIDYLLIQGIFSFQSWYFGYILALTLVLLTVLLVRMLKLKPHFIVWLPALLMAVICLSVWLADIKIIEYLDRCSKAGAYYDEGLQVGRLGEEAYKSWYLNAYFETTAIRRWLDSSLLYIASTVIFSVIGMLVYRFSRKHSRLKVLRSFALIFIFLTLICCADRRFALSARLLFKPQDFDESLLTVTFFTDDRGYGLIWGRGISTGDFGWVIKITLTRDVPVYSYPSLNSELKHVLKKGLTTDITEYMALELPSVSGWRYGSRIYKHWKDEDGLPHFFTDGYIRIEDILRAAGSSRFILRAEMMTSDILLYTKGIMVPDSIMYAFEPLEIYLLLPIALLCSLSWVTAITVRHKKAHSIKA